MGQIAFRGTTHLPSKGVMILREIEKIFLVTECQDQQKVLFATHMLADEVEYWWENTCPCLEGAGGAIVPWEEQEVDGVPRAKTGKYDSGRVCSEV